MTANFWGNSSGLYLGKMTRVKVKCTWGRFKRSNMKAMAHGTSGVLWEHRNPLAPYFQLFATNELVWWTNIFEEQIENTKANNYTQNTSKAVEVKGNHLYSYKDIKNEYIPVTHVQTITLVDMKETNGISLAFIDKLSDFVIRQVLYVVYFSYKHVCKRKELYYTP